MVPDCDREVVLLRERAPSRRRRKMKNDNDTNTREQNRSTPTAAHLTRRQLASHLGVSTRTIDNLMTRGLPYLKLTGKLVRFPRAEVENWLAQRQVTRS